MGDSATAVLVIGYNRVRQIKDCLESILPHSNCRSLYIAIDGPKSNEADISRVSSVRRLVYEMTTSTRCEYLMPAANKGCRDFVLEAISWVAGNESKFIVVEDDISVSPRFFVTCDVLLDRLKEKRLSMICGCTYADRVSRVSNAKGWFTSDIANVWGWATTSEVWADFEGWRSQDKSLAKVFWQILGRVGLRKSIHIFACYIFSVRGLIDTWDYDLCVYMLCNQRVALYPSRAMTTNLGFEASATHTKDSAPIGLASRVDLTWQEEIEYSSAWGAVIDRRYQKAMTINVPFRNAFFVQGCKGLVYLAVKGSYRYWQLIRRYLSGGKAGDA